MSDLVEQLLVAVEQQLCAPQTRYVKQTFDRLCGLGFAGDEAKSQIADCLGEVLERMLMERRGFDEKRYRALLDQLPWPEEIDES